MILLKSSIGNFSFDEKELSKLKVSIDEYEKINENEHSPKVFIFTSIDLVNSTYYKQEDKNWPTVFSEFFGIVETEFKRKNKNIHVWKYVGDEVLFYEEVNSIESLLKSPSETFRNMEISQQRLYETQKECKNKLYLKATLWIASTKHVSDSQNKHINNVLPELSESVIDFIGADIDEGFRISKFSSQNKLVLDSSLAYILYKEKPKVNRLCDYNVEDRIKIVDYKRLKGIWSNRLYPIIWYHKNWSNPTNMFLYDEHENCEIANTLRSSNFSTNNISQLDKILEEVNLKDSKIKTIYDIISECDELHLPDHPAIHNLLELHCVAVCINPSTGQALIAKRSTHKNSNNGLWEFGCAKALKTLPIVESLENEYKKDFNINIEVFVDSGRSDDCQPIPLAVYTINKENKIHKGIIFLAKIIDPTINILTTEKHSEFRWISKSELNNFNEPTIPDFKDTLEKAFELYEKDIPEK